MPLATATERTSVSIERERTFWIVCSCAMSASVLMLARLGVRRGTWYLQCNVQRNESKEEDDDDDDGDGDGDGDDDDDYGTPVRLGSLLAIERETAIRYTTGRGNRAYFSNCSR